MSKKPSFQFYPADWLSDLSLRNCSFAARGLWIELICLMHQGTPYGHLSVGGRPRHDVEMTPEMTPEMTLTSKRLAHILGANLRDVNKLLLELEKNGVFARTLNGTIYSPRMVKDEKLRNARASGGFKSIGHPNTPKPKNPNRRVPLKDTDIGYLDGSYSGVPPSSSSSSSTTKSKEREQKPLSPDFVFSEKLIQLCRDRNLDHAIILAKFKAYYLENSKSSADWDSKAKLWILNEKQSPTLNVDNVVKRVGGLPTTEPRSTAIEWGPGHPGWEAQRAWDAKHGKGSKVN